MTQIISQCYRCTHFTAPAVDEAVLGRCAAFPDGIPDAVWRNEVDHREEVEGDNDVRWAPRKRGVRHPGLRPTDMYAPPRPQR
jgi:hypothetical protein